MGQHVARSQNGISSGLSWKSFLALLQSNFLLLQPMELHEMERGMSLPAWQENHPSPVQENGLGPVLLEAIKQVNCFNTEFHMENCTISVNIVPGYVPLQTQDSFYSLLGSSKESVSA